MPTSGPDGARALCSRPGPCPRRFVSDPDPQAALPRGSEQGPPRSSCLPTRSAGRPPASVLPASPGGPRQAGHRSPAWTHFCPLLRLPGKTAGTSWDGDSVPRPPAAVGSALHAHRLLVSAEGAVEVDGPLLQMSSSPQDRAPRGHLSAAGVKGPGLGQGPLPGGLISPHIPRKAGAEPAPGLSGAPALPRSPTGHVLP